MTIPDHKTLLRLKLAARNTSVRSTSDSSTAPAIEFFGVQYNFTCPLHRYFDPEDPKRRKKT
jgi:hypothetical protein